MTADKEARQEPERGEEPGQGATAPAEQGVLRIYPPTEGEHATALGECRTAFNNGDIGSARRLARAVARAQGATHDERAFSEMILARTALDPVAIGIGLGCFALFWFVIYWFIWSGPR